MTLQIRRRRFCLLAELTHTLGCPCMVLRFPRIRTLSVPHLRLAVALIPASATTLLVTLPSFPSDTPLTDRTAADPPRMIPWRVVLRLCRIVLKDKWRLWGYWLEYNIGVGYLKGRLWFYLLGYSRETFVFGGRWRRLLGRRR